jgi:hypothetical protein
MRSIRRRHVPALVLLGGLIVLPALAHAGVTGGEAWPEGLGNLVAYGTCAGGLAVALTPAAVMAALAYCLHLLVKTIPE